MSENLFEPASVTAVDTDRTRMYQEATARENEKEAFQSEEEFLQHLQLRCSVQPINDFTAPRAAQLTQRTNQFNVRTVRYSEPQIQCLREDDSCLSLTFDLADRIGYYGVVGLILLERRGTDAFINTWLLSCRVFGKTVEQFMLNQTLKRTKAAGMHRLIGEYIPTPKNKPVADLYQRMGFREEGSYWFLDIQQAPEQMTFVTENLEKTHD